MSKNILVLTGSPRKGGNSDLLADFFIAGAKQNGHTVLKYTTADKTIKGCIDCKTCFSKGVPCSVADDFNELAKHIMKADMLVLATPLYFFSFTVQLKAAIDKFFSFYCGGKTLHIKECALLACAADHDVASFDGLVASYKLIAKHWRWENKGEFLALGVHGKGDILKTEFLQKAEDFGRSIL